jgi:crotonobetainyl-CoA:carnitine CoA-transferase CaiB-like acyl-CoA transferase
MSADLSDVTVISVEQAVAAPYASRCLADAGARVIKVERNEGDFARNYDRSVAGQSAYFVWLNRGKESVCLDLKNPADIGVLRAMIARADIFLQNLRPNLLEQLGLRTDLLRAAHPSLITCQITGFGATGPRAGLKAYDLIVQAESGLCTITGDQASPARVGVSVCDIAAGMTAHAAILQALFARSNTGRGRAISVSLFDSIAEWMNVPFLQYLHGGAAPGRSGVSHPTIAPYGAFECHDGTSLILSVQNEREWERFCAGFLSRTEFIRDSRFVDNTARVLNRKDLDAVVAERCRALTAADAAQLLENNDIAYGRLNTLESAVQHPHLRWITVQTPRADIRIAAPAAMTSETPEPLRPVPALGQHTEVVKAEFR